MWSLFEEIYTRQRKWADNFNPEILSILKSAFNCENVSISDTFSDQHLVSDFQVRIDDRILHISARIRNFKWILNCRDEFTLRDKTELPKIIKKNKGNYMFYGFTDEKEEKILFWRILDLNIFRKYYPSVKSKRLINLDTKYDLIAFNINDFPSELIYKKSILVKKSHKEMLAEL